MWHDQLAYAQLDRVYSCARAAKSLRLLKLTTVACIYTVNHADVTKGYHSAS